MKKKGGLLPHGLLAGIEFLFALLADAVILQDTFHEILSFLGHRGTSSLLAWGRI